MKTKHTITIMLFVSAIAALSGCRPRQAATDETAGASAPKVNGDRIDIPQNAPQAGAIAVESAEARRHSVCRFTGRLIWNDDSTVRIFSPIAGRVSQISAQLGQKVSAGDTLAKMASPDFGQAQADARKAQVDLLSAERTLNRVKELYAHGAAAQKDLETAEADHTRAVSEKERTAARLALWGGGASTIDQMFCLKAPIDGTVVEKSINTGSEVRPDAMMASSAQFAAPLFVISDPAKLWLQLDVTESEMTLLKPGQKLRVQSKAYPDRVFAGRIEFVGDSLDPSTRTVKVRAVVDNPEKLLKAEMYITAEVIFELTDNENPSVDVSAKAVFLKDDQHFLFIENGPGQFERRAVKLGAESNGRSVIVEGLAAGQRVVTDGSLLLEAMLDGANR